MVEITENTTGVLGARMMGGGFGGCTLNWVEKSRVSTFKDRIMAGYNTPEGDIPRIYEVQIEGETKYLKDQ